MNPIDGGVLMRGCAIAAMAALLVVLAGCGGVRALPGGPAPAVSASHKANGLVVTATASQGRFAPDQEVLVTVRARNEGTGPVGYTRFNGCDPGFRVSAKGPSGLEARFAEKVDGPPRACTEAIVTATLDPGAEVSAVYTWDQQIDGAPAPPGTYTVLASFNRQGSSVEEPAFVTASLTIALEGGRAAIGREAAIARARAEAQVAAWWQAHTGAAVAKQEGGRWFVLIARGPDDPIGEWTPAEEAFALTVAETEPEVSAAFRDGNWEVRAITKLGPGPRQVVATVDGATGSVVAVRFL